MHGYVSTLCPHKHACKVKTFIPLFTRIEGGGHFLIIFVSYSFIFIIGIRCSGRRLGCDGEGGRTGSG